MKLCGVLGHRFFEFGEEGFELVGVGADGLLDREVVFAEEIEGGCAEDRQDARGGLRADAAGVFAEDGVDLVEDFVFDLPAATRQGQQSRSVSRCSRAAGDGVCRGFRRLFATHIAFELQQLLSTRPVEIVRVDQIGGRRQPANFQAARGFVGGGRGFAAGQFGFNRRGGESLRE